VVDGRCRIERLLVASARGVWAIRSDGGAVYFLDASAGTVLRQTPTPESAGPGDGEWKRLLAVHAVAGKGPGLLRVGQRHRYLYEYDAAGPETGWWIQRRAVAIEAVGPEALAALPPRAAADDS
jgi:hypothetical protein